MLRTEQVTLKAPQARALLAYVADLEKFSEPENSGFPISKDLGWGVSKMLSDIAANEHRLGMHEYSAFCILCTAS